MAGQDLTGNQISTTYKSLLKTTNNNELPASGKVRITDGKGNDSSLFIAKNTGGASVCGNFSATGDASAANVTGSTSGTFGNLTQSGASGFLVAEGDLFVGGTSGTRCFSVDNATGFTQAGALNVCGTSSSNPTQSNSNLALNVCGIITATGQIRSKCDIIAFQSSDVNLKDNLNKICNTENIISGISGYSFDWNAKSQREGSDLGIIAQDVQKVLPTIVNERDDGYLAVDYIKLIPVLIEEVKRLNLEINELKNKIK